MSPIWTMPDGSRLYIPDSEPTIPSPSGSGQRVDVPTSALPEQVRRFLRENGRKGGQARAARHSRDEIAAWGRVRRKTKSRIV
jgi:hypothetical protein